MATIIFDDTRQAYAITLMPEMRPLLGDDRVRHYGLGRALVIPAEALDILAALPADTDGHFDGTHIHFSGNRYVVAKIDPGFNSVMRFLRQGPEPVGVTEIAERMHIRGASVEQWARRHANFPTRRWTVGNGPSWDWGLDIYPWLAETGRAFAGQDEADAAVRAVDDAHRDIKEELDRLAEAAREVFEAEVADAYQRMRDEWARIRQMDISDAEDARLMGIAERAYKDEVRAAATRRAEATGSVARRWAEVQDVATEAYRQARAAAVEAMP